MNCVWEHNGSDTLLYSAELPGAYTRGASLAEAIAKMETERKSYALWSGLDCRDGDVRITQEKSSALQVADADSDVLFDTERSPLSREEYLRLKALALKSAADFHALYSSVPDREKSCLPPRKTFYGPVPGNAREMYEHTRNVNAYYFGEIGVAADNEGRIYECRERGFERLERQPDFPDNTVSEGSYGELWSLRKLLRRFIWHDRIHAKAMYRMALRTFGPGSVENPFRFIL